MKSPVLQRIRDIADKYDLSVTALSKKIGVAQQTLNRQITGENAMSLSTIETILGCFPEISAEWLLRGEGEMMKGAETTETRQELVIYVEEDGTLKLKR